MRSPHFACHKEHRRRVLPSAPRGRGLSYRVDSEHTGAVRFLASVDTTTRSTTAKEADMFMHPEDIYSFEKARHQELKRQLELERHARRARAANRSEGHRPRRTIAFARRRWSAFIGLFSFH